MIVAVITEIGMQWLLFYIMTRMQVRYFQNVDS